MDKIRYAVIGIKGVGKYHIDLAAHFKDVELVAIVDIDSDLVASKSKEMGVRGFTDYRELLDADMVDAVSIATPHYLHYRMGIDFISNGIHILIEKPLAMTLTEANEMVSLADKKNVKLCVSHQYRTHRSSVVMKQIVDSGTIGKIMRILWTWVHYRSNAYYTQQAWRATWRDSGGGVLMNQVSHDLDLIGWLFGKPAQVCALAGNQVHRTQVDDIACVNILFENGAFGNFQFTINHPGVFNTRHVVGDKGMMVFNDVKSLIDDQDEQIMLGKFEDSVVDLAGNFDNHHYQPPVSWKKVKLPSKNDHTYAKKIVRKFDSMFLRPVTMNKLSLQRLKWLKWSKPPGHFQIFENFVDAVKNDQQPFVSGKSAARTIELINAVVLSAVRHKVVKFPLDSEEYDEVFDELCHGKTKITKIPLI